MSTPNDETRAPMTRIQRVAMIHLPVFLALAAATAWRAVAEGGDPLAAKLLVLAGVVVMVVGIVWAQSGGECPDERERAIQTKAFRNAFFLVFIGVLAVVEFDGPNGAWWDAARAATAVAYLAMAVWAGSVLVYARRGD